MCLISELLYYDTVRHSTTRSTELVSQTRCRTFLCNNLLLIMAQRYRERKSHVIWLWLVDDSLIMFKYSIFYIYKKECFFFYLLVNLSIEISLLKLLEIKSTFVFDYL